MFSVTSDTWAAVKKQLLKDRAIYLEALAMDRDQLETAKFRGRIAQIDEVLSSYPKILAPGNTPDDE